jgi:integrase
MRLVEIARAYVSQNIGLSARYQKDILSVARRCSEFCGCVNGSMPSSQQIAAWFAACLDRGLSPNTLLRYRRNLSAIIRFGVESGLCEAIRLPKIKGRASVPKAWTLEEFEAVLAEAARTPGFVGKVPACDWWAALLLTLYWTGARVGSVLNATPQDIDLDRGILVLTKTKNRKTAIYRLHPQAIDAIRKIYDRDAQRLFYWPYQGPWFFKVLRQIVARSGVPCPKGNASLTYRIKRTALTYCWAIDPAIAQRQADHSSAQTTLRYYVDPRLVALHAQCAADVLPVPKLETGPTYRQGFLFPVD